ncbi:unnamed protein product, partial [Soboliphyme baturini]|uniref:DNA-directed RNA polymerase n=1 Tax=Soboliphyme baturini TaxID=241478 RepID=A0A183J2J5_9BILA
MLADLVKEKIRNQDDALRCLGGLFRVVLQMPSFHSDVKVGRFLLHSCICIHLFEEKAKFDFLVFAAQKLAALVRGEIVEESPDNPMFQEVATPGHLVLMLIKSSGFVILAERLNYLRFISHFRGIHRGAFYTHMRSTEVRKLRLEAWGFICPVHTPDGTPCGLLNHLASSCCVTYSESTKAVLEVMPLCGAISCSMATVANAFSGRDSYHVIVDGHVAGVIDYVGARKLESLLRADKLKLHSGVRKFVELAFIERTAYKGFYPAFYVFTDAGRMMRPVRNLCFDSPNNVEYIGTLEQAFMNICIYPSEIEPETTHQEISPSSMLSYVANLIPYPDHNQSPRNVYQCQMSKQTVGVPVHTIRSRTDGKLYMLQAPQMPLVKPSAYDRYNINEYPLGTNAIVAVISYTGYDMEDAMIINKASFERGFAHACIYKTERIQLNSGNSGFGKEKNFIFHRDPSMPELSNFLDCDGLPYIGRLCIEKEPFYCVLDLNSGMYNVKNYTGNEEMFVDC